MSDVSVDIIKNRSGEAPDLPSGANLSGVSTAATLQVTNLNPTHINASGVTTATTFSGSMKSTGTPTLGLGVTINSSGINISGVATAGIVSATTLYGDGSNLTGIAMSIAPISYNPDVGDTGVLLDTGIGITFTERIIAGSGNITLRVAGAAGTVVENFGVGNSVTINNNKISFTPTSNLSAMETYYVNIPSSAITNTAGDTALAATNWTFQGEPGDDLFAVGNSNYYGGGIADPGVGMLGQNNTTSYSSPVQIPGEWADGEFKKSIHSDTAGAIKEDGGLYTWGYGGHGGLGHSSKTNYSSPKQVGSGTDWNAVCMMQTFTMATKTDGTLWAWGYNSHGMLGQNNTTDYSSPKQIPGTTWSQPFGTHRFAGCVKTDGTLWTWGNSQGFGLPGQNQPNNLFQSSPVQVPGTTWSKVKSGRDFNSAIKTDGTLWGWGRNSYGSIGDGKTNTDSPGNYYSSPVQIPGTTWSVISPGLYNSAAVKTDGTLWAWGYNSSGELGQNNRTNYSSPVQVGSDTTWSKVAMSRYVWATKTDGTVWTWGHNDSGQLGLNNKTKYSSPVQVPGSNWGWIHSNSYSYGTSLMSFKQSI